MFFKKLCIKKIIVSAFITAIVLPQPAFCLSEKFINKIETSIPTELLKSENKLPLEKDITLIVYLAGVNNLGYFLRKNLNQLSEIGSNNHMNILVQLDVLLAGNKKVTKRYFVEKNKLIILNQNDPSSQSMDSGDPKSLINWCDYCVKHFKAKKYLLVLSNHATGIIDIKQVRAVNPSQLFTFNPMTNMIELNRTVPFLEYIASPDNQRGICFDDITGNYLTNQKLDFALKKICEQSIRGKFEAIIFDACLQQMYEIALLIKPYAKLMLGSQEVILAPGLDYIDVLKPYEHQKIDMLPFAKHIVQSFENTYKKLTNDYTFSAVNLSDVTMLEQNVNTVASILTECLKNKKYNLIKEAIKTSRHKLLCTHFDEPSYIDLHHFYKNLLLNLDRLELKNARDKEIYKAVLPELKNKLKEGMALVDHVVISYVAGKNLSQARGISIYFPEFGNKHPSYQHKHPWGLFIDHYLLALQN